MLMIICVSHPPPPSLCITLKGEYTVIITWRGVGAVRPSDFPSQLYQIPFTSTQSHPTTYRSNGEPLVPTTYSTFSILHMCLLSPFSIIYSTYHNLMSLFYILHLISSVLSVSCLCLLYTLSLMLYSISLVSLPPILTFSHALFYRSLVSASYTYFLSCSIL